MAKCAGTQKKPPKGTDKKILDMSQRGLSVSAIARGLGISTALLKAWRENHPELQNALDEGREIEHTKLRSALMDQVRIPANVTGHSGDRDRFAHGPHAGESFVR